MKWFYVSLFTVYFIALSGCHSALLDMQHQNTAIQMSNLEKEQQLNTLSNEKAYLMQQNQDLQAQRLSIDAEFNALSEDFLRLQNELKTARSAHKIHANEITKLKKQIESVQKSPQDTENDLNSKQRKIQELKDEIRTRLKMGLH